MSLDFNLKLSELFHYRKFPVLFDYVNETYKNHELVQDLFELQKSIYHLDSYLETNWQIDSNNLEIYWSDINNKLTQLGVHPKLHEDYCRHLKKISKA